MKSQFLQFINATDNVYFEQNKIPKKVTTLHIRLHKINKKLHKAMHFELYLRPSVVLILIIKI